VVPRWEPPFVLTNGGFVMSWKLWMNR
jgi:hypothetical protein